MREPVRRWRSGRLSVDGHPSAGGVGDEGGTEQLAGGPCAGLGSGQNPPGCFGGDGGRCADTFAGHQFGYGTVPVRGDSLGPGAGAGSVAISKRPAMTGDGD